MAFGNESVEKRRHDDTFEEARAASIAESCLYYTPEIHRACFALPGFAADAVANGTNPFARFDRRVRMFVENSGG